MPREENNDTHQTVPTPNPNERVLFVTVEESVFSENPDALPVLNTRYADCDRALFGPDYKRQFDDWIYIDQMPNRSNGRAVLVFGNNKTEEEKNTPFRSVPSMGNHYWPPILLDIEIEKSRVPRSVDTGDRIYKGFTYTATPIYHPNADTGTLFILNLYSSATQFDIPQSPTPITRAVNFPVPGSRPFSFPECLGPDITVLEMEDSDSSYDPVSLTISSNLGLTTPWFFPATDPKTWAPYILYDRQEKDASGLWIRTQMWVYPPNLPKRQRGLQ